MVLIRRAVVDQIGRDHPMTGVTKYPHDSARTAGWLPDRPRKWFGAQQRERGHLGRFVEIVTAGGIGVTDQHDSNPSFWKRGLPVGIRVSKRGFSCLDPPRVLACPEWPQRVFDRLAKPNLADLVAGAIEALGADRAERTLRLHGVGVGFIGMTVHERPAIPARTDRKARLAILVRRAARHPCCARAVSAKGFSEFGGDHMATSVKWRPGCAIRFRRLFGGSSSSYQILGRYLFAQDRPKLCGGLFVFGQTGGRATLGQPVSQVRLAPSDGARCEPDRFGKGAGLDTAPNRGPRKACDLSDFAGSQDPIEGLLGHWSPQGEIERDPLNKPETMRRSRNKCNSKKSRQNHRDLSRFALPMSEVSLLYRCLASF